jgi:hypothetical protein
MYIIILNKLHRNCNIPFDVACNLFEKMIVPILIYGSEIWGFRKYEAIEIVQRKFLKQYLGLGSQSSNFAVYGETGRYPLYVNYMCKCIKYWLKMVQVENCKYAKECYNMLFNVSDYRKTWASEIRDLLFRYGFGCVWLAQGVGDQMLFIQNFNQRLCDMWKQDWHANVSCQSKLSTYIMFKCEFVSHPAKYLLSIKFRRHMIA